MIEKQPTNFETLLDEEGFTSDEEAKIRQKYPNGLAPYTARYEELKRTITDPSDPSHSQNCHITGLCARGIRKIVGISIMEVAELLGIDPYQIQAFERGMIPEEGMPEIYRQYWDDTIANWFTERGFGELALVCGDGLRKYLGNNSASGRAAN